MVHGLTAGTDTTENWLPMLMIATSVAVAMLTIVRVVNLTSGKPRRTALSARALPPA